MIGYVKMLWQKCVPHELCRYIYLKDNNLIWTQLQITFQKANVIFKDFVRHNSKHLNLLKKYLIENAKIYQHLYATLYSKFYPRTENRLLFDLLYREQINSMNNQPAAASATVNSVAAGTTASTKRTEIAKDSENYKRLPSTINEFEQVLLAHDKYWFIPKTTVQKIKSTFTAKEQMHCRKELKKIKNEQKKADTWEKTGKKHGKNEQNWQTLIVK